jgi:predicted deacetylase
MIAHGVSGVLMRFMGLMGWICTKMSRRVVKSFLVIPDLRRKMSLKLDSNITSGVQTRSLKDIFLDL